MQTFDIYCAGQFISTQNPLEVTNPFNNQAFAQTYLAGETELEQAIQAAQDCMPALRSMPSHKKSKALFEIAQGLQDQLETLATLLAHESGKPMIYARGEIMRSIQTFKIAGEECKRLPGEIIQLDWTPAGEGRKGYVQYFPIGLVAGISPFNFPMNLAVHKIAPALAAGCPIVLKPSTNTPLSTLALARIIDNTDFPKGSLSILPMNRKNGNQLVTDSRFKLLSFTGSPAVGWRMKEQSGPKKVVLELGGNAGLLVSDDCNLDLAVEKAVIGGFAYSGQVCIHAQRIYVHRKIFETFSQKFIQKVAQLTFGNPLESTTQISAMIDEDNAIRIENWVNEALESGAKILCGGKRFGTYYEPTVLVETKPQMKVCALEVFGPVVSLEPFDDFKEAIEGINQSEFGLQAGVFTNRISEMDYAFENLEVGGVILNDAPIFRVDHMPYGGIKNSGLGREGVKYAMMDMLEPRILVK